MKKVLLIILLNLSVGIASADVQESISETTKSVISFGKNFMKGVNDGVDEGRKETAGVDDAITVTNVEEMEQYITVEIIRVESAMNDTETHIIVGFKNKESRPVRIANMDDKGIVLLIDSDGYSQGLSLTSRYDSEFTVLGSTGKKTYV